MVHWIAHEDGSLDIIDSCGTKLHSGVYNALVRIITTTNGDVKNIRALTGSAWSTSHGCST
jgi:hypothetical protein